MRRKKLFAIMLASMMMVSAIDHTVDTIGGYNIMAKETMSNGSQLLDWSYTLSGDDKVILQQYKGQANDVVVPGELEGRNVLLNNTTSALPMRVTSVVIGDETNKVGIHNPGSLNIFKDKENLIRADIRYLDTSDITDMSDSFSGGSLKQLDMEGIDTGKVKNMSNMFRDATKLEAINFSGLDLSKVTDTYFMFHNCKSLKTVNLKGVSAANLTNAKGMFAECTSLESINLEGFEAPKLNSTTHMFLRCEALRHLDLQGFNVNGIKKLEIVGMFNYCKNLTILDISNQVWTYDQLYMSGLSVLGDVKDKATVVITKDANVERHIDKIFQGRNIRVPINIKYDGNGGYINGKQEAAYLDKLYTDSITDVARVKKELVQKYVAVREEYDFIGWYEDSRCTKKIEGTKEDIDIEDYAGGTLYAGWERKSTASTTTEEVTTTATTAATTEEITPTESADDMDAENTEYATEIVGEGYGSERAKPSEQPQELGKDRKKDEKEKKQPFSKMIQVGDRSHSMIILMIVALSSLATGIVGFRKR